MLSIFFKNNPVVITNLFFLGSILLSIIVCTQNNTIKTIFKKNWGILFFFLILNFCLKTPLNFFDGLEYEDAYIYKSAARFIYENNDDLKIEGNTYLTNACIWGSLNDCEVTGEYSAHLIGYPCVINLVHKIFGYSPNQGNIVSLVFSTASILLVYIIAYLIFADRLYASLCCLINISIPIFNVFASTAFSELTSNFFVSLFFLIYLCYIYYPNKNGQNDKWLSFFNWLCIFFTFAFVVLIKRENIILLFALPFGAIIYQYFNKASKKQKRKQIRQLLKLTPAFAAIILFYFYIVNVPSTVLVESNEIQQPPFSIFYLKSQIPIYLKSFLQWRWYLFYSPFLLLGFFSCSKDTKLVVPVLVFLCYFIVYTAHYRHYYFIKTGSFSPFEIIRYMMGFISFYSIICGMGMYKFTSFISKKFNTNFALIKASNVLIVITLAVSLFFTHSLRAEFFEAENSNRIQPVKQVLKKINPDNAVVITSRSLLFQLYGDPKLSVVDFAFLVPQINNSLLKTNKDIYYLEMIEDISPLNKNRYASQFELLNIFKKQCMSQGVNFTIYKLYL